MRPRPAPRTRCRAERTHAVQGTCARARTRARAHCLTTIDFVRELRAAQQRISLDLGVILLRSTARTLGARVLPLHVEQARKLANCAHVYGVRSPTVVCRGQLLAQTRPLGRLAPAPPAAFTMGGRTDPGEEHHCHQDQLARHPAAADLENQLENPRNFVF